MRIYCEEEEYVCFTRLVCSDCIWGYIYATVRDLNINFKKGVTYVLEIWGIILVLLSGIGVAAFLVRGEDSRLVCARTALGLMAYVKSSVDNYSTTASEILRERYEDIVDGLGYPEGKEAPKSFIEMCEGCEMSDSTVRDILIEFAQGFGKHYRREQSEDCQITLEKLRFRVSQLEKELPGRKKMIFSICISVSLVLIILLL